MQICCFLSSLHDGIHAIISKPAQTTQMRIAAAAVDEVYFSRYYRLGSLLSLISSAVLENVGYRQLHVIWRLQGWWQSLRGTEQQWGVMTRRGFTTEEAS